MGFSIKSQLGSNSTLLNASKATNISYKLIGDTLSDTKINSINNYNGESKIIDRINSIKSSGLSFQFEKADNETFYENLTMIDSDLLEIISFLLLEQFTSENNHIHHLINKIAEYNPLNYITVNEVI